ncbi:hypothetical protein C8F01DRAFT_1252509 [Mycena amicta]|nr:hypothetical protein C8F01DRAFT_1252509 [Mycena amicta]
MYICTWRQTGGHPPLLWTTLFPTTTLERLPSVAIVVGDTAYIKIGDKVSFRTPTSPLDYSLPYHNARTPPERHYRQARHPLHQNRCSVVSDTHLSPGPPSPSPHRANAFRTSLSSSSTPLASKSVQCRFRYPPLPWTTLTLTTPRERLPDVTIVKLDTPCIKIGAVSFQIPTSPLDHPHPHHTARTHSRPSLSSRATLPASKSVQVSDLEENDNFFTHRYPPLPWTTLTHTILLERLLAVAIVELDTSNSNSVQKPCLPLF